MRALKHLPTMLRPSFAWYALFAALALTLIGIIAIGGSSEPERAGAQSTWLVIALCAMAFCMLPNPKLISQAAAPLLLVFIGALLVLITPGVPGWLVRPRQGTRGWINLHFMDFQPSEIVKILFVLVLARHMRFRANYLTLGGLAGPFAIMFVPVVLINLQPDLGTAILFVPALFVVLLVGGVRLRHVIILVGLGLAAVLINVAVVAYDPPHASTARLPRFVHLLQSHQERRIAAMIWPKNYEAREGYQQDIAMNLVGAAQLTGYDAPESATIVRFSNLPLDYNDMVYAIVVNRWGLLGGLFVMGLYLMLIACLFFIAMRSKDPFARLSMVGFAGLIGTQAGINIGMTLGLLPIIGITLPFVSYGGSSLVGSFIMIGLTLNFAARPPTMLARPSFEFDNGEAMFQ